MKLVGYELRKTLSGRFWWLALLFLLAANLLLYSEPWNGVSFFSWKTLSEDFAPLKEFVASASAEEYHAYIAEMEERYGEYDYFSSWDSITDDSPGRFASTMTQEVQLLAYHLNQCASFERVVGERARIETAARWAGGTAYLKNDAFGVRKSMDMIRRYAVKPAIIPALATAENSGPPFSAMPKWGWINFIDYIWGDVFAVLMAALLATRLFPMERKARPILLATPKGRRQTTAAKLAAAAILGLGMSVLFSAVTLLFIGFKDGLYGADGSILTVGAMTFTPLVATIAQTVLLFALYRVAGVVLVSLACAVIAYFLRGNLLSYIGGIVFVGGSFGYSVLIGRNPFLPTALRVLPDITSLSRPQWFFETYRAANLFGYPVLWSTVCLLFWTALCAALAGFAVWHSGYSGRRRRV